MSYNECRDYQKDSIERIESWLSGDEKEACLSLATGMGKTKVALESVAKNKLKPVIWSTHKLGLLDQSSAEELVNNIFENYGYKPKIAIISGQKKEDIMNADLIFVSAGMLEEDKTILDDLNKLNPELFIIDEAHNKRDIYQEIRKIFKTLNLTATPYDPVTLESMDLGVDVGNKTLKEAVDMGVCVPVTLAQFDIAAELMETTKIWEKIQDPEILNKVLDKIEPFIKEERTLMCLKNLKEVETVQTELKKRGMKYGVISANEKKDLELNEDFLKDKPADISYRSFLLQKLRNKEIDGLLNYDVLIEGIDIPELSRAVSFRPLDTANKFAQLIGRLSRTAEGKTGALYIDIADTDVSLGSELLMEVVQGRKKRHMSAVLNVNQPKNVTEQDIYESSHYKIKEVLEFQKGGKLPLPIDPLTVEKSNTIKVGSKEIDFRELDFDKEDMVYLPKGIPINQDILKLKEIQTVRNKRIKKIKEKTKKYAKLNIISDMANAEVTENGYKTKDVEINFEKLNDVYRMAIKKGEKEQKLCFKKGASLLTKDREVGEAMEGEKNLAYLTQVLELPENIVRRLIPEKVALKFSRFLRKNNTKGFKKSCIGGVENSSLWSCYELGKEVLGVQLNRI